ncbi:MAG: YggS family pyridoxal phosphate-dependent enzyme [Clostridia bacterium]|nr:YggS family pyridoxal phosphate-dependent enzyme [Clostridia bacterium]MBQ4543200.1 YggS family pyridoxal phosphate-dependent enzyme [Clostridia bacterium]
MLIEERIEVVKNNIEQSAKLSGRTSKDISLIAVSKTIDIETVKEVHKLGINDFGENKPQELRDKIPEIPEASWHMIGRLQSNKIKYVVGKTKLIQSVDNLELMQKINDFAIKTGVVQDILIQVNMSKEIQKAGIDENDIDRILLEACSMKNIKVKGLMTIGSAFMTEYELEKMFEKCNNIFVDKKQKKYDNIDMEYLSMGMSGDYMTAIRCGSNMVRIGSGIFGPRNYNI